MEPGVKVDLIVAEHVLGYGWKEIPKHIRIVGRAAEKDGKFLVPHNAYFPTEAEARGGELFYQADVPAFSTLLKDAWQVIDLIKKFKIPCPSHPNSFMTFHLECNREGFIAGWQHNFVDDKDACDNDQFSSFQLTAPHAICAAALKAMGAGNGVTD
jgi:hypothetical protein